MGTFLFSIDLEDVSVELEGAGEYTARVRAMTGKYLTLLQKYNAKATFFVVGEIAREFPALISEIIAEGHEIACHSDLHVATEKLSPESFRIDLINNKESLYKAGAKNIIGFRAPYFSMTSKTQWAYSILKELGFTYSSSVMPMGNPLYGWKEFGSKIRVVDGIFEIPISVSFLKKFQSPLAGGIYFRVFPLCLIYRFFKLRKKRHIPIIGYFHPQDCDDNGRKLKYKDYNWLYNFLLNYNKSSVIKKLEFLLKHGFQIVRYDEFCQTTDLSV